MGHPAGLTRAIAALDHRARIKSNKIEAAKEMKNMVLFSNIIVSPLLEDAWGEAGRKVSKQGGPVYRSGSPLDSLPPALLPRLWRSATSSRPSSRRS